MFFDCRFFPYHMYIGNYLAITRRRVQFNIYIILCKIYNGMPPTVPVSYHDVFNWYFTIQIFLLRMKSIIPDNKLYLCIIPNILYYYGFFRVIRAWLQSETCYDYFFFNLVILRYCVFYFNYSYRKFTRNWI